MANKRKKKEEHINHERWLVSYADFITLLFAFFVVMYSISSVNQGKYRVLSESLITAFHTTTRSMQPIQVGKIAKSGPPPDHPIKGFPTLVHIRGMPASNVRIVTTASGSSHSRGNSVMQNIGVSIEKRLSALISAKLISVKVHREWVDIRIHTDILFPSGSSALAAKARPVIDRVAKAVHSLPLQIMVEGFTDNVPIHSKVFPSNWELSAARAASVVQQMIEQGVQPQYMAAVGYGKYHPIATNATSKGRSQNRRVELVLVARHKPLPKKATPTGLNVPPFAGNH